MDSKLLLETIRDMNKNISGILESNVEANTRHHRSDMRSLALLKAIVAEIVRADPTAKARMHRSLDQLLMLHGDDKIFCDGIKEAVKVVGAT